MASKSLWMDIDVMPAAGALDGDASCDVAVVGSGIAGLSTAYELMPSAACPSSSLTAKRIAGGMTARTSAHLAPLCDDLMSEFRKIRGARCGDGCSTKARPPRSIGSKPSRSRRGHRLRLPPCSTAIFFRATGHAGRCHRSGARRRARGRRARSPAGRRSPPGLRKPPCAPLSAQAAFHPLKYLAGVAKACTRAACVPCRQSGDGSGRGQWQCRRVNIARDNPGRARRGRDQLLDIRPLRPPHQDGALSNYVIAFEIERGALPDALY